MRLAVSSASVARPSFRMLGRAVAAAGQQVGVVRVLVKEQPRRAARVLVLRQRQPLGADGADHHLGGTRAARLARDVHGRQRPVVGEAGKGPESGGHGAEQHVEAAAAPGGRLVVGSEERAHGRQQQSVRHRRRIAQPAELRRVEERRGRRVPQIDDDGDAARDGDDLRPEAGHRFRRLMADLRRPGEPVDEAQRVPDDRRRIARVEGDRRLRVVARQRGQLGHRRLHRRAGTACGEWCERSACVGRCERRGGGVTGAEEADGDQHPLGLHLRRRDRQVGGAQHVVLVGRREAQTVQVVRREDARLAPGAARRSAGRVRRRRSAPIHPPTPSPRACRFRRRAWTAPGTRRRCRSGRRAPSLSRRRAGASAGW